MLQPAAGVSEHTGGHPGHAVHGQPVIFREPAAALEQQSVQKPQPAEEQLARGGGGEEERRRRHEAADQTPL